MKTPKKEPTWLGVWKARVNNEPEGRELGAAMLIEVTTSRSIDCALLVSNSGLYFPVYLSGS
jgi:hypothetical protein